MQDAPPQITPQLLLQAYAHGVFPMSEGVDDPEIFWVDPKARGVFPLDRFHLSRSMRKRIRQEKYQIRVDTAFDQVVAACADRDETWINAEISALYHALFTLGFAHSVEVWDNDALVGGVYGVALGAAFFGESMFSRRKDCSKLALAYLVARLNAGGFTLFDTQFITPHLASLGAQEIPRAAYLDLLDKALAKRADFGKLPDWNYPSEIIHLSTQIS